MKTNAKRIPNRNKNANLRFAPPPCQFAGTASVFARATHRTESKTRRNPQSRNNFATLGFLFGAGDSLGYTSSPVLGMLAPCVGARQVPEATVGHGFTFIG
jgi:hypothetical protein